MIEVKTMCALKLLDTAKDEKINHAEFTTAAEEFLFGPGVEETQISKDLLWATIGLSLLTTTKKKIL
jgi:hypothetical protein